MGNVKDANAFGTLYESFNQPAHWLKPPHPVAAPVLARPRKRRVLFLRAMSRWRSIPCPMRCK